MRKHALCSLLIAAVFFSSLSHAASGVEDIRGEEPSNTDVIHIFSLDATGVMALDGVETGGESLGNSLHPAAMGPSGEVKAEILDRVQLEDGRTAYELRIVQMNGNPAAVVTNIETNRMVLADESWVFLAEDLQTEVNESQARFVSILDYGVAGDARVFLTGTWNEKNGPFTGQYNQYGSTKRYMDTDFLSFLGKNLLTCVNQGLGAVGKGKASQIHLVHNGVVADQNHKSTSLHSVSRAIDIKQIIARGGSVSSLTIDYSTARKSSKSWQRKFYVKLRSCFDGLHKARGCLSRRSGNPRGTIAWEDSRHGSHLHLSMPYCPNRTNKVGRRFNVAEGSAPQIGGYLAKLLKSATASNPHCS